MTEPTGFTDDMGEPDLDAREDDGAIDNDVVFGDDEVDAELDRSYSPPERARGLDAFGTTLAEQRQGESLDQRLAEEELDPAMAVEASDDDWREDRRDDDLVGDDRRDDAPESRSGRLVAPDEGLSADEEKDLIASDVGIDGGAASAEEAAVHIVHDEAADDEAGDEGWTN